MDTPPATPSDAAFACARCGACCRQPGEVRLEPGEADALAAFLHLPVHAFTAAYARLRPDRRGLALTETADGACIFLAPDGCRVHPVKPRQCRTYPTAWRIPGDAQFCRAARLTSDPV